MSTKTLPAFSRGISLIELILFIVIIGIAVTGVVWAMSRVTAHSADALVSKQAQAIAESMLEEVQLQPLTKTVGGFPGPYTPENRHRFDSVRDYSGLTMTGISDPAGASIAGLGNYNLALAVTPAMLGDIASAVRITVTVTDPAGGTMVMEGYRTEHN